MRLRFKALIATAATGALLATAAVPASAAPLPDNCTKVQGEVRCFDGPGKNQGGVGTTTETQGNTSNTSPEPQDLGSTCRPPQSEGVCGG
jgi:hypothetical protein